ncbi:pre-mRNA-splicing factor SYF1 [Neoconidiobolus thromboides FSU 785]|nr:pre-mRNA-splicing factor SYF1 [Neoconidiobolus thromboides FSU 785]
MVNAVEQSLAAYIEDDDVPYEEEVVRNPYSVKVWLRYIDFKEEKINDNKAGYHPKPLFIIFERALKELPKSYKIWKRYLDTRKYYIREKFHPIKDSEEYKKMNHCYERSLFLLNKMPRIWTDYAIFLMIQGDITKARRTFDRALRALPVTQHSRIWPFYLKFAKKIGGETALRVFKRYIRLEVEMIEDYIDLLLEQDNIDEAAYQLSRMIDLDLPSSRGKTPYQLWVELSDLICSKPQSIKRLDVEAILRSGIIRFTDQVGKLWCLLAKYWILLGKFDKARENFEEGISSVKTLRDFAQIFDAYTEFEESVLRSMSEEGEESGVELDLGIMRLEHLINRRPLLLNDVLLRQNPHNVEEWIKRVDLFRDSKVKVVETFNEAVKTISPKKATPEMLPELWKLFAKFYEDNDDLNTARKIYDKAVKVPYKLVSELANLWQEYAEMEIRQDNFDKAIEVLSRATKPPMKYKSINFHDESLSVQDRLFKSLKLWSFYVDLQESAGTPEATREVYDQILDLKIANPQTIVNYANYLEELEYFEDSFKVYERGLELFNYPIAFEIWNIYLTKFIKRYGGKKIERTRDLFEQAIEHCPAKYAKPIYLLYGKFEEDYGLAKHALKIYSRATIAVESKDKYEIFQYYIAKATQAFGITSAREIYDQAVNVLPDAKAKDMCIEYAALERKLGEIDRARKIYAYASQFCDPRITQNFWQIWHDFEVQHGNEDTFKDMLRIKRSVQAQYNTEVNHLSAQLISSRDNEGGSEPLPGFVKSKESLVPYSNEEENTSEKRKAEAENPDELEI